MRWRFFSRPQTAARDAGWWEAAERLAAAPDADALHALRRAAGAARSSDDEREEQEEMLHALERVLGMSASPVPVVATQHRVVGADTCHLVVPAATVGEGAVPGKLFVTSSRIVFAGTASDVQSDAWHRVRAVARRGRIVRCDLAIGEPGHAYQCNTFADALAVAHLAARVGRRGTLPS